MKIIASKGSILGEIQQATKKTDAMAFCIPIDVSVFVGEPELSFEVIREEI